MTTMTKLLTSITGVLFLFACGCVPQPQPLNEDIVARFNSAVEDSVQKSHSETMTELQEYRSTLERIEQAIVELQTKAKETKPSIETTKVVRLDSTPVVAQPGVTRMPGSNWNVQGNWNYTITELADHLRSDHGVNVDGKTLSELQAMHDNLHNGYSAYGSTARATQSVAPIQYYTPRQTPTIFRRTRSYSTCPPGQPCPQ